MADILFFLLRLAVWYISVQIAYGAGYSRGRDDGVHDVIERIKPDLREAYPELFKEE